MLQIFFVTVYITCKLSVQFCTFPHSVYKGTKTTDFFVTAVWPKPLTEMTIVKLSYQLELTNHTILYK